MECLVLHGWTDTAKNLRRVTLHHLPQGINFHFINAPYSNEWFEYSYSRKKTLLGSYDLEYKSLLQIQTSMQILEEHIHNYAKDGRDVIVVATSQGATIALHTVMNMKHLPNFKGVWLHNIAGIYDNLITPSSIRNFQVHFVTTNKTSNHALDLTNQDVKNSLYSFVKRAHLRCRKPLLYFFDVQTDDVIPPPVKAYVRDYFRF